MTDDSEPWLNETSDIAPLDSGAKNKAFANIHPSPKASPKPNTAPTARIEPIIHRPIKALKPISIGDFSDIDGATIRKLKRGKIHIGAKLDLHGMTQREALDALEQFIFSQVGERKKLVLIVTGKGSLSAPSVLKTKLPEWLSSPQLRPHIIAFDQARAEHGGNGAFYVLLRKRTL